MTSGWGAKCSWHWREVTRCQTSNNIEECRLMKIAELTGARSEWRRRGFALVAGLLLIVGDLRGASAPMPAVVYTFDATPLNRQDLSAATNAMRLWDSLHVLTAVQGIVNREAPRFYLFYCSEFGVETDRFWFDWLRLEHGWLKDAEVRPLPSLEAVVAQFRDRIKGVVVYDGSVPATSNLGSTAAGVDDLLPVRWDSAPGSIYDLLVRQLNIPVKLWLVEPDGKPKFTGRGRDAGQRAGVQRQRQGGCVPVGDGAFPALKPLRQGSRGVLRGCLLDSAPAAGRSDDAYLVEPRLFHCAPRVLFRLVAVGAMSRRTTIPGNRRSRSQDACWRF